MIGERNRKNQEGGINGVRVRGWTVGGTRRRVRKLPIARTRFLERKASLSGTREVRPPNYLISYLSTG